MGSTEYGNGTPEVLPPPPPISSDTTPIRVEPYLKKKKIVKVPMARRGVKSKGEKIQLLTNHFKLSYNLDLHFFHVQVALFYEDGRPVDPVQRTYGSELADKQFAYDGEKTLFTMGALPRNKIEFTVVLQEMTSNRNNVNAIPGGPGSPNDTDKKTMKRPYNSKTFKVELSNAAKNSMQSIANALRGQKGCFLVRQSFFHNDPKNFADVGGDVL